MNCVTRDGSLFWMLYPDTSVGGSCFRMLLGGMGVALFIGVGHIAILLLLLFETPWRLFVFGILYIFPPKLFSYIFPNIGFRGEKWHFRIKVKP